MEIRNVAIVAHVDHGKTTLVDRLIQQTVLGEREVLPERALDSNELERERGITILAKTTAVEFEGHRINIVDTPGHADFGGEVERILSMVDAVLLVVDAVEGPMPQTRFVSQKFLEAGLIPVLVVNKVDRPGARSEAVVEEVFDLLDHLGASNEQLDFDTVYTSALDGTSGLDVNTMSGDMQPLLETIVNVVPPPPLRDGPFRMQISTTDYSPYVGVIGIGRVHQGQVNARDDVTVIDREGGSRQGRVLSLHANRGLKRTELESASAGDIVCISGLPDLTVSDTVCDTKAPQALPPLDVDEPTMTMTFQVNTSPLAGRDGSRLTPGQLRDRLFTEATHNVSLRVRRTNRTDSFEVSGRGELHLSVLLETMRREGFEITVSQPEVILKTVDGVLCEPFENVSFDIESTHQGRLIDAIGDRKGELLELIPEEHGRVRIDFKVATRAMRGFKSEFATMTSGSGVMTYASAGFAPVLDGLATTRSKGVLISNAPGKAVAYALFNLQNRGRLLVDPGTDVYEGMIVGIHSRDNDLDVNPMKGKKLTNIRAAANDENVLLSPPIELTIENALGLINDDEFVEITPNAIRLRKRHLKVQDRKQRADRAS